MALLILISEHVLSRRSVHRMGEQRKEVEEENVRMPGQIGPAPQPERESAGAGGVRRVRGQSVQRRRGHHDESSFGV
jgi:hypothetical protein